MQSYLDELTQNVRLVDFLDIAVIAVLLYCTLSWLRQRASRSLAIGLALLAGLFFCARWLDMYLTTWLFEVGFTAVLLTVIVVFQQDIRRAIDRLAARGPFKLSRPSAPHVDEIDVLVESVVAMANSRTGALIVLAGREPLERHVRGGVAVDARVSMPLLCSIFHPHSPGHDGAVVIDGARIDKLGVHLPLSTNLPQLGQRGTRHAAALGLVERCDALVLAVSEERGTISVAEHGTLREVAADELAARVGRHYRDRREPCEKVAWHQGLTRHMGTRLAALCIACALWLLFAYRVETIQRTIVIPIEYRNLPVNWVIDEPRPSRAELTLSGSERDFDLLDESALAVSFDLSHVRSETPYVLSAQESLKNVPAELNVSQVRPREVRVTVRRKPADDS